MRSPFPQPLSWSSLVYLYFILHTFLHQIIIFLLVTKRIFSYYCTTTTTTTLYPFNGLFSRTTWVSRYQKGKTSLDLNEVGDDRVLGWQWHQLDHMQTISASLQTDNHTNTSWLNLYRPGALPGAQPTVPEHRRHITYYCNDVWISGADRDRERERGDGDFLDDHDEREADGLDEREEVDPARLDVAQVDEVRLVLDRHRQNVQTLDELDKTRDADHTCTNVFVFFHSCRVFIF